jgi:hypothetical protein
MEQSSLLDEKISRCSWIFMKLPLKPPQKETPLFLLNDGWSRLVPAILIVVVVLQINNPNKSHFKLKKVSVLINRNTLYLLK